VMSQKFNVGVAGSWTQIQTQHWSAEYYLSSEYVDDLFYFYLSFL